MLRRCYETANRRNSKRCRNGDKTRLDNRTIGQFMPPTKNCHFNQPYELSSNCGVLFVSLVGWLFGFFFLSFFPFFIMAQPKRSNYVRSCSDVISNRLSASVNKSKKQNCLLGSNGFASFSRVLLFFSQFNTRKQNRQLTRLTLHNVPPTPTRGFCCRSEDGILNTGSKKKEEKKRQFMHGQNGPGFISSSFIIIIIIIIFFKSEIMIDV